MSIRFDFSNSDRNYLTIPNFKKLEEVNKKWKCRESDILYSVVSEIDITSIHMHLYRSEAEWGSHIYKLISMLVNTDDYGNNSEVLRFDEMFVGINDIRDFKHFVRIVEIVEDRLINDK